MVEDFHTKTVNLEIESRKKTQSNTADQSTLVYNSKRCNHPIHPAKISISFSA